MSTSIPQLGFHYFPDDLHFSEADLRTWLPILKQLRARWLTVKASHDRAVPEHFVRGLLDARIQPIIHITSKVEDVSLRALQPQLESYRAWGVRDVVLFDRPNLKATWSNTAWCQSGFIDRFVDMQLKVWDLYRQLGLQLYFPPLEPGGDYWDTAFLESALDSIARRGASEQLEDTIIACYAFTAGKALDWGIGGPSQWPEARPYLTPEGCQDQRGFRIFDWYSAITESVVGKSLPMAVIAGGAVSDQSSSPIGSDPHVEENSAIVRFLQSEGRRSNIRSFSFYLLTADPQNDEAEAAWFPSAEEPLPVVEAVERILKSKKTSKTQFTKKHLSHYVLLPKSTHRNVSDDWVNIAPFVLAVRPVIGFSPLEAQLAQRVSIIADEMSIPTSVEEMLIDSGCEVMRYEEIGEELLLAASELADTTLVGESHGQDDIH